ncbi:anti-sigma F factor antagonist [Alicyclobacillus cellulosilyticus]|nr:anti-sigma F factor antagonist [Alicyclobacillus cellulosilyticus]
MEVHKVDGVLVVRLQGELDHHVVEQIRDEIERELAWVRHRALVLSCRGVSFMDSSGLGLVLGRYRSVSSHRGRMALCEVGPSLMKLFELSGILKIVPVFPDEEQAIAHVKEA